MKFRRKPIVVDATRMPSGNWFVRWPWGDVTMTEEQFKREYTETDPDALVGCSCNLPFLIENDRPKNFVLDHAPNCPLYSY